MTQNFNFTPERIKSLLKEYEYVTDMWDERTEIEMAAMKIYNKLPAAERIIMLIYAETKSLKRTAEILDCGTSLLTKEVHRIQKKMKEDIDKCI